mgnify:CR=1 FL=1
MSFIILRLIRYSLVLVARLFTSSTVRASVSGVLYVKSALYRMAQREEMAMAVLRVMDMIDLLPQNSMERTVVELRHIDCKGWEQIAREVYMSRSAVFNYYNAALDLKRGEGVPTASPKRRPWATVKRADQAATVGAATGKGERSKARPR